MEPPYVFYQTLTNLLFVTSPWCFFPAHPLLLKSFMIAQAESSRPPTFKHGNRLKHVYSNVFKDVGKVTRFDSSNLSGAMSRIDEYV